MHNIFMHQIQFEFYSIKLSSSQNLLKKELIHFGFKCDFTNKNA
jgi:hypothetical protein